MNFFRTIFSGLTLFAFLSCNSQTKSPALTGKLIFTYSGDIASYEFGNKKQKTLLKGGRQPFVASGGDVYYVNEKFPKRNVLIRKSNAAFIKFSDVLDMSADNPEYKKSLDEYSVINGTGISAVLDHLSDPRVSPNGKYLSVTIFGYPGQAFEKNCVGVFDLATGKLVTKFDDKFYGTWLADGRLLMSGSYKSSSSDDHVTHSPTPGIFITDAQLGNLKRIDDELNDPAPYHAVASPDGKKVSFILNMHLWVMDIDGKNLKQLTETDNDNAESFPTWSPDGKSIACWSYKSFEKSYFTAIAIIPASTAKPIELTNKSTVWIRDTKGNRVSGGSDQISWVK